MIKLVVFATMINGEPQIVEGALFNEHDWEYVIEARRRGNKIKAVAGAGMD